MNEYEDMTSAVVAVGILVGIGLLAIRAVRTVMPYELWKFLHLSTYVVLLLSYGHQFADGQQLFRPGPARTYWIGLYVAVLVCLAWGRVVGPLLLNLGHDFRVAEVVHEGPDVVSIYLSGRRLRQTGRAGQFFRWRFLARGVWTQAHPFSLSAAANGRWLRLTVKTVGRHTEALRGLHPGVRVWAQGPMGSFTAVRRTRGRALLIAGGIGIGPIRALLEELPLGASVIYRASTADDVVLREELDRLAELRQADVWYVIGSRYDAGPAGTADRVRDAADRARRGQPGRLPVRPARVREGGPGGAAPGRGTAPAAARHAVRVLRRGRGAAGIRDVGRAGGRHHAARLAEERARGEPPAGRLRRGALADARRRRRRWTCRPCRPRPCPGRARRRRPRGPSTRPPSAAAPHDRAAPTAAARAARRPSSWATRP